MVDQAVLQTMASGATRCIDAAAGREVTEHFFTDAPTCAKALAEKIAQALRQALSRLYTADSVPSREVVLAVSGGRSPRPLLIELAQQTLDWHRVVVTLVDERWVDAHDDASKERLVRETLLQGPAAAARFVPLKSNAATAAAALDEREQALPAELDVVVLGMGADGHTASLLPGAPELPAALEPGAHRRLMAITSPTVSPPRITLTLAALVSAGRLFLQIQGTEKRAMWTRACVGDRALPITHVLQARRCPVDIFICTAS